jgi:hypothetical protein
LKVHQSDISQGLVDMRKKPIGIATIAIDGIGTFTVQPKVDEFGVSEGGRIQHCRRVALTNFTTCPKLQRSLAYPFITTCTAITLTPHVFF